MLRLKPVAACCSDSFSWNEQGNSRWVGAEQLGGNAINTLPHGTGGGWEPLRLIRGENRNRDALKRWFRNGGQRNSSALLDQLLPGSLQLLGQSAMPGKSEAEGETERLGQLRDQPLKHAVLVSIQSTGTDLSRGKDQSHGVITGMKADPSLSKVINQLDGFGSSGLKQR